MMIYDNDDDEEEEVEEDYQENRQCGFYALETFSLVQ